MVNDQLIGALDALGVKVEDPEVAGDRLRLANILYGTAEREIMDAMQDPDSPHDAAQSEGAVDAAGRWEDWQLPLATKWRLCRLAKTLERMILARETVDPALFAAYQAVMLALWLLVYQMASELVGAELECGPEQHRRLQELATTSLSDAQDCSDDIADTVIELRELVENH
jgi:hypothetical protein